MHEPFYLHYENRIKVLAALIKVYYVRREIMNKKRAAGLVAALLVANGISGGYWQLAISSMK